MEKVCALPNVKELKPLKKLDQYLMLSSVLAERDYVNVNLCVKASDKERKELYVVKMYSNLEDGANEENAKKLERFSKANAKLLTLSDKEGHSIMYPVQYVKSQTTGNVYLISKYANGRSLKDLFNNESKLQEAEVRQLLQAMVSALLYLKSIGIVHTAVSPGNILIEVSDKGERTFYLSGLENAVCIEDLSSLPTEYFTYMQYASPMCKDGSYTAADFDRSYTYSLALICYNVLVGSEEDPSDDCFIDRIELIRGISRELKYLLASCLMQPNPHPWSLEDLKSSHFVARVPEPLLPVLKFPKIRYKKDASFNPRRGSFGKVRRFYDSVTQKHVAIKSMATESSGDKKREELLRGEVFLLAEMQKSSFVVKLIDSFRYRQKLYLVLEYINGQSLEDYFKVSKRSLAEDEIAIVAWSSANALYELHKLHRMMHRDVKADNILVSLDEGRINDAKLADFNVSRKYKAEMLGKTFAGTVQYMAPEVMNLPFDKHEYNEKADVWSYGILLMYLHLRKTPCDIVGEEYYMDKLKKKESLIGTEFQNYSAELKDLLTGCLRYNPAERLSMEEILNHNWFSYLRRGLAVRPSMEPYVYSEGSQIQTTEQTDRLSDHRTYVCKDTKTKQEYALVLYSNYQSNTSLQKLKRGLHVWSFLRSCDHIARLIEYFVIGPDLYVIREYCDKEILYQRVIKGISKEQAITLARELFYILKEMHSRYILHRGLNPNSLVVIESHDQDLKVKVKDFDMARVAYNELMSSAATNDDIYIAPEYTFGNSQTYFEADIWSYGLLLYFVTHGQHAPECNSDGSVLKTTGRLPKGLPSRAPELERLIEACVKVAPKDRIPLDEIERQVFKPI